MNRTTLTISAITFLATAAWMNADVAIHEDDGEWRVSIDGETFTTYRHKDLNTPSLYPVFGPGGVRMTRKYPLEDAAEGEAKDHIHHVSLWYNHGNVNGIDFWHPQSKNGGKISHSKLVKKENGDYKATLVTANKWSSLEDDTAVCDDEREMIFGVLDDGSRYIDLKITIKATYGDVRFGDTKEGTMAIRTHPNLRLKGEVAKGQAINSEGHKGGELWGKAAKWVDYWGPVEGKEVGVAIFDHPSNPRHPTTWHARDYGLIAANPFGYSDFFPGQNKKGDLTIEKGESISFRYRFIFHKGGPDAAGVAEKFEIYAKQ